MKKKVFYAFVASAMLLLPGCVADTYELTEEEQDLIAEYAAGVLLKSDETYTQALLTPIPTPTPEPTATPTPEPTPTAEPGSSTGSGSNGGSTQVVANADLTEVFGLAGLQAEFSGYQICDSCEDELSPSYVVHPASGNRLVKAEIKFTNESGITQEIPFATLGILYQLDCNEQSFAQPMITVLSRDLTYLTASIPAGQSEIYYIIFQISSSADMSDANLIVSRGDTTAIIAVNE